MGQPDSRRDALGLDARRNAGSGRGYRRDCPLGHVADTTSAHSATGVDITDAGAYYTGTTVEAALQEIGAGGIGGGGGGSAITAKDEGTNLTTAATSFDFVGAGVTATNTGGAVTVTVPGGSGATHPIPMPGCRSQLSSVGHRNSCGTPPTP
jgi:hypothetical protein